MVKRKHGNIHPTQKPVALFEYLINTYSNENDLVLDNCAGSGKGKDGKGKDKGGSGKAPKVLKQAQIS